MGFHCMVASGRGNSKGVWNGYVYTAIFKMNNQKGLLNFPQNSAQCFPHPNPNFESKVGGKQSQGHETAESRTLNATRSGERA